MPAGEEHGGHTPHIARDDDWTSDIGLVDGLDLDAFDLPELPEVEGVGPDLPVPTQTLRAKIDRATKRQVVHYDRAVEMAEQVAEVVFRERGRIDAVLSGNFIFGDLFEALAVRYSLLIDRLTISTLSLSIDNVESFRNLIDGDYLRRLDLIVSDYWFSHNRRNVPYIMEALGQPDRCAFRLAVAGTHTKIALLETHGRKVVFSGSANLRSSRSIESMTVEDSPELFDFHAAWHDRILDDFELGGTRRASDLWNVITA